MKPINKLLLKSFLWICLMIILFSLDNSLDFDFYLVVTFFVGFWIGVGFMLDKKEVKKKNEIK
ncbi:MAG: hypothetical protein ACOC56_03290 [Atribacterota bacterium]